MSGPHPEPEVRVASSRPEWIALLSGPSLWFGHFMATYLLAEVACRGGLLLGPVAGLSWLAWIVLAGTAAAIAVLAFAAWQTRAHRRRDTGGGHLLDVALALDALFAVAILYVGLPVVVIAPC